MTQRLNEETLARLRGILPRGSVSLIAERLGLHQTTVSKVLLGHFMNQQVIDEAVAMAKEQIAKEQAFNNRIAEQLSKTVAA